MASRSGAAWRLRGSGAAELTGSLKSATQELTVTLEHNSTTSEFRRQTQNEDAAASFEVQGCAEEGKHIFEYEHALELMRCAMTRRDTGDVDQRTGSITGQGQLKDPKP